jgi:hypothetical protein
MFMIGRGRAREFAKAAEEALQAIHAPSLLLYLTSPLYLEEATRIIAQKYPYTPSLGVPSIILCGKDVDLDKLVIVAGDAACEAVCDVMEHLSLCPVQDIMKLEKKVKSIQPEPGSTVCLEFCPGYEERLVTTLNSILNGYQIPLLGATISNNIGNEERRVAVNGRIYRDSCGYLLCKYKAGQIRIYKEDIYGPADNVMHQVTKVRPEQRELIELDHRPAAQVYSEKLDVLADDIRENTMLNPLGRRIGKELFVTSISYVGEDGALFTYKKLNLNDAVYFMKLLDYKEIAPKTIARIKADFAQIELIFSINCIFRFLLFTQEDFMHEQLKALSALGPQVGIVSDGEQVLTQHMNQTMACMVFGSES